MKSLKFFIITLAFLCPTLFTHAASLYFDSQETTVGTLKPFIIGVLIDAKEKVNALEIHIQFPDGIEPVDASDGNSIVNNWIEKAHFDPITRVLTFSGIIPGGFYGEAGRVMTIQCKANKTGSFDIQFDAKTTKVLLNEVNSPEDQLAYKNLYLLVEKGRDNLINEIPDADAPEPFTPKIARDPSMFNGKWFVTFNTQDEISGIYRYEISETYAGAKRDWKIAESPYVLKDQNLQSHIYIKAVDKKGNEKVEYAQPVNKAPWYVYAKWYIIIASCVVLLFVIRKFYF